MAMDKYYKLLCALLIHLCIGAVYAWSTLVLPIEEVTGWGKIHVIFAFSVIIFSLSLSSFFAKRICSILGLSKTCLLGSLLFSIFYILIGISVHLNSILFFYIFCVLAGLGIGICYILTVDMAMKWFPKNKGVVGGYCIIAFGFGAGLASISLSTLVAYHPCIAMISTGLIYLLVMTICSYYLSYPKEYEYDIESLEIVYYDKKKFTKLFMSLMVNIGCGISLIPILSPAIQELGATPFFAAICVSIIGISNGVGRLIWIRVSEKVGIDNTYQILFVSQAVLFILLGLTSNTWIFTILCVLIMSMFGGGFALIPLFLSELFKHPTRQDQQQTTVVDLYSETLLTWGLSGVAAPIFLSIVYDITGDVSDVFYIYGIIFLISAYIRNKFKINY